jgi:lipopolysaccharide transport system ATP-binding protein
MPDAVVTANKITKTYKLYRNHSDRVKETFHPLRKAYSTPFNALDNVTFEIFKGETFGIVGKNGSGKSTLLQIISGVLQPTSGELSVSGRITSLLELGVGFNPEFSGMENIYLAGAILGLNREQMNGKIDDILSFADIGDFIYQPVKTYSSGMGVRLSFSIYSVVDPEVFIVDEALAVGDAFFVHRCMLRFNEMQEQGKTIILVSHDGSAIKRLCQRSLWLDGGKVQLIGKSSEVVDNYIDHIFSHKRSNVTNDTKRKNIDNIDSLNSSGKIIPENHIPNIDKRIGDGVCKIIGIALYNSNLKPISVAANGSIVILRITFINVSLANIHPLCIGYIFRDSRGIDIASTHSEIEGVTINHLSVGESLTTSFEIELPLIYPGTYSFSPSLSYIKNGEHIVCDRIMNAIVFEITSAYEMHVLLRLKTLVTVEG